MSDQGEIPVPCTLKRCRQEDEPPEMAFDYQILEKVGSGGMADVYRADGPLGEVAVKRLKQMPGISEEAKLAARFVREAKIAQRAGRHDSGGHLVPIYDIGVDDYGGLYIAMKFIGDGYRGAHSLDQLIEQRIEQVYRPNADGRVPRIQEALFTRVEICEIFRQMLDGVGTLHEAGVVHRDLKPENVLLSTRPDGKMHLMISDYGIAKSFGDGMSDSLGRPLTKQGQMFGTPHYMAPEQLMYGGRRQKLPDGKEVFWKDGPPSDLWALGVILYYLVTGRHPFIEDDSVLPTDPQAYVDALGSRIVELGVAMTPFAAHVDNPDPGLERFVGRLLEKTPWKRLQTIAEAVRYFEEDFGAHLDRSLKATTKPPPGVPALVVVEDEHEVASFDPQRETERLIRSPSSGKLPLVGIGLVAAALIGLSVFLVARLHDGKTNVPAPGASEQVSAAPPATASSAAPAPLATASVTAPVSAKASAPTAPRRKPAGVLVKGSQQEKDFASGLAAAKAGRCKDAEMQMHLVRAMSPGFPDTLPVLAFCARGKPADVRKYCADYDAFETHVSSTQSFYDAACVKQP